MIRPVEAGGASTIKVHWFEEKYTRLKHESEELEAIRGKEGRRRRDATEEAYSRGRDDFINFFFSSAKGGRWRDGLGKKKEF